MSPRPCLLDRDEALRPLGGRASDMRYKKKEVYGSDNKSISNGWWSVNKDMGGVCNFVCNLRWCAVNKNYTGRQKETPEENLETVAGVRENPNTLRRNMLGFWWRRGELNPWIKRRKPLGHNGY